MSLPTNNTSQKGGTRRFITIGLLVLWLCLLVLAALNRQNIIDWWRLRQYQAPAAINSLATQTTLTNYGRKVFFVNWPELKDKDNFSDACPDNGGEQTIVLGCYHGNQAGIFLLDVNDPRLEGVEQVTAAHETLHAAYDRLSKKDRTKVDSMVMKYYTNQLKDQRILATIEAYKKSEPNDWRNEMHSIFGTEVTNLPAELEDYYRRYFTNRAQVAAFAARYQAAFISRKATIDKADAELERLKTQITAAQDSLKTRLAAIDAQQAELVNLRNNGNVAAYNAGVPAYNTAVDAYNRQVAEVRELIERYNRLVASRNAVAQEQDQLVKELRSDAAPIRQ